MNIAEAAYRVGLQLKKIEKGRAIESLYNRVKGNTTDSAWKAFTKSYRRSGIINYYSIPYAYYLLESNKDEENLPEYLMKDIEEIINNEEYKALCEISEFFGDAIDKLMLDILSPSIPKNFAGTVAKPKLKRAIQDLHMACQRTGFLHYALNVHQNNSTDTSTFEKKRENYPYTKINRRLISEMSKNDKDKETLYFYESLESLLQFVKELIFEAHLGIFTSVNSDYIKKMNTRSFSKIDKFLIVLEDYLYSFENEGCTILIKMGNEFSYGLIQSSRMSFKNEAMKTTYRGLLYPTRDINLFR